MPTTRFVATLFGFAVMVLLSMITDGTADTITILGGDNQVIQQSASDIKLFAPLSVRLTNSDDVPLAGRRIMFLQMGCAFSGCYINGPNATPLLLTPRAAPGSSRPAFLFTPLAIAFYVTTDAQGEASFNSLTATPSGTEDAFAKNVGQVTISAGEVTTTAGEHGDTGRSVGASNTNQRLSNQVSFHLTVLPPVSPAPAVVAVLTMVAGVGQKARWYSKAIDQGSAFTDANFWNMCANGQDVPHGSDVTLAWLRKTADQGNAIAQADLGDRYRRGQGVPQDYAAALTWLRMAADQGDALAQFDLGSMYFNGQGSAQDYDGALTRFRKAANQGNADAQAIP